MLRLAAEVNTLKSEPIIVIVSFVIVSFAEVFSVFSNTVTDRTTSAFHRALKPVMKGELRRSFMIEQRCLFCGHASLSSQFRLW